MLKRLISVGSAAIAGLLSACQDGPSSVAGWRSPATWSSMVYATNHGPMALQTHGFVLGLDSQNLAPSFALAMSNQVFGRPFPVTTDAATAPQPHLRMIWVFNGPESLDSRQICRGNIPKSTIPSDKITIHAVFCEHDSLLSSAQGWVAKVQTPDDRRLQQLLAQITRDLFGSPP